MIEAIDVAPITETNYINENNLKLRTLENVKKINIFIGENNSGKSRLLRSLITKNDLYTFDKNIISENYLNYCKNNINQIYRYLDEFNRGPNKIYFERKDLSEPINRYIELTNLTHLNKELLSIPVCGTKYFDHIISHLDELRNNLTNNNRRNIFSAKNIVYIPILRGIECFNQYFELTHSKDLDSITMNQVQRNAMDDYKKNAKVIYQNKISKVYGIEKRKIFTAENLYDEITAKLLGVESGRNFIHDFQKFISEEFYDSQEFTIIPQQKEGYLSVKIGNESDKPLHDLGDGIKQMITILYKVFEKKDEDTIFLIEEPELNLHPSYQRKLIKIFQSKEFEKLQFFITTHSNHLIDSCFDYDNISLFKFINVNKSNHTFKVINTSPNDVEMLQLLGVNNSSVFMANCTIWVEGISDKILISKYLEVYLKHKGLSKYKEGINYSFVEYGGNNIVHWSFIQSDAIDKINASGITNRCFIICDNDNDKKKERKQNLKSIFEDNYYELPVREIENTIKKDVLDKTLLKDASSSIKLEFNEKDYARKDIYMGEFIDKHYNLRKKYKSTSGTINSKLEFSKKIASNIFSYNDLSSKAIKLCDSIFAFIEKSNNNDQYA